ncbi:MAG TPA: hypothetical protein PLY68_09940 [Myxococcota bacterium]|nr:hypothetical protein [Myxococcota bacterium]HPB51527.1 hypothetical protein [Myxococcota bacterium]HQP96499.1 hypothetical protein [Myxococcota bacterium]
MKAVVSRDACVIGSFSLVLTAFVLLSVMVGCGARGGAAGPSSVAAAPASASPLARIVLVDEEECCNCTRDRINATASALTEALGQPPAFPVERLHKDTQPEMVATYSTFRPIMVIPAVYFLDANDAILDMLQGELKPEQITAVINRLK